MEQYDWWYFGITTQLGGSHRWVDQKSSDRMTKEFKKGYHTALYEVAKWLAEIENKHYPKAFFLERIRHMEPK